MKIDIFKLFPSMDLSVHKGGSRSTAKLQMEFFVKTMPPFLEKYTLLRIAVPYF